MTSYFQNIDKKKIFGHIYRFLEGFPFCETPILINCPVWLKNDFSDL
jgi:hypothetical protein